MSEMKSYEPLWLASAELVADVWPSKAILNSSHAAVWRDGSGSLIAVLLVEVNQ